MHDNARPRSPGELEPSHRNTNEHISQCIIILASTYSTRHELRLNLAVDTAAAPTVRRIDEWIASLSRASLRRCCLQTG